MHTGCFYGWVILSNNIMWSLWNPVTGKTIHLPPLVLNDGDCDDINHCCLPSHLDDPSLVLCYKLVNKLLDKLVAREVNVYDPRLDTNVNNGTPNGTPLVLDEETRRLLAETIAGMVEGSLASIQRSMADMANDITALSLLNNQVVNKGPQLNHSRMAKIEFPKFSSEDVKRWVFTCKQFFLLEQTPDLDKVTLISIHLYDKALLWHSQFVRAHGANVGWEVYKKAILARFDNVYEDPMSELKNLKYETTAREYEDAFDSILSRVEVSEEHVVSLFMGGLSTEIEMG
ncbi:putative mitochondrial protein, partial [Tanacetum coccineum]